MKILYTPNIKWNKSPPVNFGRETVLSLSGNNWDDYDYKTTLNAKLIFDGKVLDFHFNLKILIRNSTYTAETLNELCSSGWDGHFPIPKLDYISIPSDIDFYKSLIAKIGPQNTEKTLEILHDASILSHSEKHPSYSLTNDDGFKLSLLRESGAHKAYLDGWKVLKGELSEVKNFTLFMQSRTGEKKEIPFQFESSLLPYDINVLIGPNGIGKSHSLKTIVSGWLQSEDKKAELFFDKRPNIGRLILISYSPFEEFDLTLKKSNLLDKAAYKYFGFRHRTGTEEDGSAKIGINRNLPAFDSSNSLITSIYDDQKTSFIIDKVKKLEAAERALKPALGYDYLALEVLPESVTTSLKNKITEIKGRNYLKIDKDIPLLIDNSNLVNLCKLTEGVKFISNGEIISLSSGQRLFTYIVINVLGSIRENSLVVIDEPELFLHPTLEIEFISLLKAILKPFRSKAILATHSLAVVREVPSKCVHIFKEVDGILDIIPPPFETFGASVQRISSYVFGDSSLTKPFDDWLSRLVKDEPDVDTLISLLGDEINEQLIMKISKLGRLHNGN
ncbi:MULTISPECIES: AAA family ATPase [Aeromonas]|uniref:AAA family ATPase n=1 Tax=Aeromonas TaxID=642 RepID=UPI0009E2E960|nr:MULTISPECIES: AAA family ATPase [Aeromonas]MBL0675603.1 ATP-binding protein [Aeromonas dhakensis]MCR3949704.1 ATP-binding protein [Aeromonas hydrophila]MDX7743092.1 AAA family ATPase [Aeromonas dhakensis]